MGVAVALMIVFLFLGFLIGTRARQVAASVKNVGAALKSFSFKIPKPSEMESTNDGGEDDDHVDDDRADDDTVDLDKYAQPVEADSVLADHPDLQISPVVLYNIKKAKNELRKAQRRAALLAEGMGEAEAEEQMEMEALAGGSGGGGGKQNALQLLISVGARFEATGGSASMEMQALQERRRLQRNVDGYLNKVHGVEKLRVTDKPPKPARDAGGHRIKSANEVAKETETRRAGGAFYERELKNLRFAAEARDVYRVYQQEQAKLAPAEGVEMRSRAGAVGSSQLDQLALIQAEFAGDDDDDDDDEGDEGEEGEEGLAA